jgi:hypothetical protein
MGESLYLLSRYPTNEKGFLWWRQSLLVYVGGTSIVCQRGDVVHARGGSKRKGNGIVVVFEIFLNGELVLIHCDDVVVTDWLVEGKEVMEDASRELQRF